MALGEERMKSKLKVWRLAALPKGECTDGSLWRYHMLLGEAPTIDKGSGSWRMLSAELNWFVPLQCKGTPIRADEPWLIKSLTGYEVIFYNWGKPVILTFFSFPTL